MAFPTRPEIQDRRDIVVEISISMAIMLPADATRVSEKTGRIPADVVSQAADSVRL
jgi:hypothetical protein